MKKYYVNLPGGTTDSEFQLVLDLLIAQGYKNNASRKPHRVRQPDGSYKEQGFLFLFDDRAEAKRFLKVVREKSKNVSWEIFEVNVELIQELIAEHRQLRDEPLVLAMYYDAGDKPGDIYLLEIIDNFGSNSINPDRELFELTYWAPNTKSTGVGQTWHLVLTNPPEFERALKEKWTHAEKIRRAVNAGRYEVLFMSDAEGIHSRELIHA